MDKQNKRALFFIGGIVIGCLIISAIFLFTSRNSDENDINEHENESEQENIIKFQGPVPKGYDEEHFRKPGELINKRIEK